MLRRLSILGVLLLSLAGFIPAALACAVMAQHMDCCPPDQTCETNQGPAWTDNTALACCDAVSSHAPTAAVVSLEIKKYSQDLPPPEFPGAHPGVITSRGPPQYSRPDASQFALPPDQQDLYLQTGRLRL
jgi:hypothetical protein